MTIARRRLFWTGAATVLAAVAGPLIAPATRAFAWDYPLKFFHEVKDPSHANDLEKQHFINLRTPVIAEDGANVPVVVSMEEHPMTPDHYIKTLQVINFNDPVVGKGLYSFFPANGSAYLSLQVRADGGDAEIFAIAECTQHGKWFTRKSVKVSLGGC